MEKEIIMKKNTWIFIFVWMVSVTAHGGLISATKRAMNPSAMQYKDMEKAFKAQSKIKKPTKVDYAKNKIQHDKSKAQLLGKKPRKKFLQSVAKDNANAKKVIHEAKFTTKLKKFPGKVLGGSKDLVKRMLPFI